MGICLITGVSSEAHVTSADAGALNAGIVGTGRYVLPIGRQFEYELISNNSIRIKDGYALNQGRLIGIRLDDYEDLNIENGISGTKRNDIVVIRYEMDINTGFETAMLDIIKGISGDVGVDPVMENGDILNGEIYDVMPLYRICFEGLNILKIEPIFQKYQHYAMEVNGLRITSLIILM